MTNKPPLRNSRFTKPYKLLLLFLFLPAVAKPAAVIQDDNPDRDPVVWRVSFEGNDNYSNIVLRRTIAARHPNLGRKLIRRYSDYKLNETELRRDRIRILRYYQRRGYSDVEVDLVIEPRRKEWKKDVIFRIREGEPIRITESEVVIDADSITKKQLRESRDFNRQIDRHEFRQGNLYQTIRKPDIEGRFVESLQNHGYPWATIAIESEVDSTAKTARVRIIAKPGTKAYFTNFEFEGVETVPERIVMRETDIHPGDVYSRRKLQEAQRQIFGHHLFRFATITLPEQPQDSTLDVLVRVRENPLRTVQASVGFGNEELLRGQLSWQHRNISGTGHRLGFSGRGSFIAQRVGADYTIPYVFNNRSSFVTAPYGQRRTEPAFDLLRAGLNNSLIYQVRRNFTLTGSYEFSINRENTRRDDVTLPDSVLDYNVSSLLFTGYYSEGISREPTGWVIQPTAEFSGTFGEATFRFQKFSLDVRHFKPISESTTIAGRINTGVIFYSQPDSLPANIRFFAGGTNSVRGWTRQTLGPKRATFDENGNFDGYVPLGGRAMFNFNLELRQQLNELITGLGFALFLDGGQVWRALDRIDERAVQFGTGGGIRYQSPIGPIRVDVGYKLNPFDEDLKRFAGEEFGGRMSRIGIHFSIGQAF